jgi:hypothetical protein
MIRAFILAFCPKARFYRSAVDGTLCVEWPQTLPGEKSWSTAHAFARRIVSFKRRGW